MLCNMGYGMDAKNSKAGVRKLRTGSRILFACSRVAVEHHTMPHIFLKYKASGKGGAGGTVRKAKNPLISSGAWTMNSRYHFITSEAWSRCHNIGPAHTICTGYAWNRNDVTTPKFPPPPRIAQNRSVFSFALATANLPSANTTSAAN